MFNFCLDKQNAEALWPLLPLFHQLLTTGYNTTMPIQCGCKLTADPIFLFCCEANADPWSKSTDWCGLKILGSAHLWCSQRQGHAWRETPSMFCLGRSHSTAAGIVSSACIKAQTMIKAGHRVLVESWE